MSPTVNTTIWMQIGCKTFGPSFLTAESARIFSSFDQATYDNAYSTLKAFWLVRYKDYQFKSNKIKKTQSKTNHSDSYSCFGLNYLFSIDSNVSSEMFRLGYYILPAIVNQKSGFFEHCKYYPVAVLTIRKAWSEIKLFTFSFDSTIELFLADWISCLASITIWFCKRKTIEYFVSCNVIIYINKWNQYKNFHRRQNIQILIFVAEYILHHSTTTN